MSLLDVYPLFDIEPVRGEGAYIFDKQGKKYLDFYGGHAVISIGHSHPHYVKSLIDQAEKLVFYSNSIINSLQKEVDDKLKQVSGIGEGYNFFMINSGAEAIENAVKMASFSNEKKRFIALEGSFHGRTAAAISLTHKMKYRTSYDLDSEIVFIPINDSERLEKALSSRDVCAVIVEPIQGIAGIKICTNKFLKDIRKLTQEYDAMFIADEIQCGFGRSGEFFAHQYAGVQPDIITMAKGMGNGFPIGGVLVKKEILEAEYGMAGTTFGGNHLACRAASAVLDVIEKERLLDNANSIGNYLVSNLKKLQGVKEIRGRGLMIGIEMEFPVKDLRKTLLYEKMIFTGSSSDPNVLRLLPPLNITQVECDKLFDGLVSLLNSSSF